MSLFTHDMVIYVEKIWKNWEKKLLESVSDYSKVAGRKVNIQIQSLYTSSGQEKFEI